MLWSKTPLLHSVPLTKASGHPVWMKLEAMHPTGSFKHRGMGALCQWAVDQGHERLVTSSGGNAGYAVAWCARQLGVPVTVVVPSRTSALMRQRIADLGADTRVHGEIWPEAHAHAQTIAETEGGFLVHPFDHPAVWEGNASMITEVAETMERPGSIVASVGGGGLLAGVLRGMDEVGWSDVPVLAMETHGTASFGAAMAAGEAVTLPGISGVALTLGASRVCDEVVALGMAHDVTVDAVSDHDAVDAVERYLHDHRILVEPACGAALAPVYAGHPALRGPVLVIVCGGASATPASLASWQEASKD